MQLKRLHKNISEVGKRAYPKTKFPQSKQDGSELTPLEDYIENKLPRCPLYDQLREIRVPMGNYLDFSEVNETVCYHSNFHLSSNFLARNRCWKN